MKKVMLGFICVLLAGCEYTVPLIKSPDIEIDKSVVGLWERLNDNAEVESLLILPLGKYEYMVSFPAGSEDAMFARASLWRDDDMTLFQLDWFGTARAKIPNTRRTFQFGKYEVEGNRISVCLLNAEIVDPDIASSEELAKSITVNRARADLFKKAMVFTKN